MLKELEKCFDAGWFLLWEEAEEVTRINIGPDNDKN